VLAGAGLAACSSLSEQEVRDAAAAFTAADPAGRCALLAPGTLASLEREEEAPCAQAVGQLPLGSGEVTSVQVWGEDALVRLSDDTLFLTLTDRGWQVSAGACEPQPDAPYVCRLEAS
jgi:hypothetical protein